MRGKTTAQDPEHQAGPTSPRTTAPPATGAASPVDAGTVCDRPAADETIPPDFRAGTVWQCAPTIRQLPDGDLSSVTAVRQADGAAADLVRALRAPSASPGDDPCTADSVVAAPLVLGDAQGRRVSPLVPTDQCGHPQGAVGKALSELPLRTVAVIPHEPAPG